MSQKWVFDWGRNILWLKGRSDNPLGVIMLTNRESDMIDVLLKNKGRCVTKETFRTAIWGWVDEPESWECNLRVSVYHLRRKLIPAKIKIVTVPLRGYYLTPTEHDIVSDS